MGGWGHCPFPAAHLRLLLPAGSVPLRPAGASAPSGIPAPQIWGGGGPSPTDSGIPTPQILVAKRRERSSLHPPPVGSSAQPFPGAVPMAPSPPPVCPLPKLLGDKTVGGGGLRLPHAAPSPGGGQDAPAAAVFAQGIGCGADVHPAAPTGPRGRRHWGRVPPPPHSLLMSAPGPGGWGGTPRAPCLRQRVFAPRLGGLRGGVIKPKEHSGPHPAPWPAPGSACSASPAPASSCGVLGSGGCGWPPARRRRSW